jgi:hypothetical protein
MGSGAGGRVCRPGGEAPTPEARDDEPIQVRSRERDVRGLVRDDAVGVVAFTLSFDEFAIASFLAGGQQTWPVYLFAQLRVPSLLPQLIAVSSVVFIASKLLVAAAEIGRRLAARKYGSEYTARALV